MLSARYSAIGIKSHYIEVLSVGLKGLVSKNFSVKSFASANHLCFSACVYPSPAKTRSTFFWKIPGAAEYFAYWVTDEPCLALAFDHILTFWNNKVSRPSFRIGRLQGDLLVQVPGKFSIGYFGHINFDRSKPMQCGTWILDVVLG